MNIRSAFHLDCYSMIPECQFQCAKCLQEIQSVLANIEAIAKSYTEGEGENMKFIVEHDSSIITAEQLMNIFKSLPSFYKGFFIPKLITS